MDPFQFQPLLNPTLSSNATRHPNPTSGISGLSVNAVVVSNGVGLLNITGMFLVLIHGSVCGTTVPFKMM